jgi:hypothetical protein
VAGGEDEGEDGAKVGVDALDSGGIDPGSKSRSGIGGESKGRIVARNRVIRSKALV